LALFKKKPPRVWIFKAYDRHRKRLIDWECGDRTSSTFQRLYERLKDYQGLFYWADHWRGFNKIIPSERLYQGKNKTIAIERNNCQQRHWFARFKRKSIVVSQSREMIEATRRIFAAVHINKTLNLNLKLC
jgi:insertion element IS1 protein InsB